MTDRSWSRLWSIGQGGNDLQVVVRGFENLIELCLDRNFVLMTGSRERQWLIVRES